MDIPGACVFKHRSNKKTWVAEPWREDALRAFVRHDGKR